MEHDKRQLQPIKVGQASVESGKERFTQDGWTSALPISQWRNNLTALSQKYNLYFVASRANVMVYIPSFPFQTLGRKPRMTIPPSPTNPEARGFIDTRYPHTINHIIVGNLGTEEILLLATDSGNVAAYHTKAIRDAIEKDPYAYSSDGRSDLMGLRPFFSHWVYESAWGLAIHQHARMIAVSANRPRYLDTDDPCAKVTVFAFALTGHGNVHDMKEETIYTGVDEESDWKTWMPNSRGESISDRSQNIKIVLSGHDDNIPSISFVNTIHDREGEWLLSTDVAGQTKLWHIWPQKVLKSWDFSDRDKPRYARTDPLERGWIVLALDPASFRSASTTEELTGGPRIITYHPNVGSKESYNITNTVQLQTPGISHYHPTFGPVTETHMRNEEEEPLESLEQGWSDDEIGDIPDDISRSAIPNSNDTNNIGDLLQSDVGDIVEMGDSLNSAQEDDGHVLEEGISANDADRLIERLSRSGQESEDIEMATNLDGDENLVDQSTLQQSLIFSGEQEDEEEEDEEEDDDDEEEDEYEDEVDEDDEEDDEEDEEGEEGEEEEDDDDEEEEDIDMQELHSGIDVGSTTTFFPPLNGSGAMCFSPSLKHYKQSKSYQDVHDAYLAAKAIRTARMLRSIDSVPFLQCSVSHIRLLSGPFAQTPHFHCARALRQYLPEALQRSPLPQMDRLNMIQYAPELGIVVIGTQIGRCALCTLTKRTQSGTPGFRIDWVLPTKKQENDGLRPFAPLLGIALGPVQGRENDTEDNDEERERDTSLSHSDKPDDEGQDDGFATDRVIDGVPTFFDPFIVCLEADANTETDDELPQESPSKSPQMQGMPRNTNVQDFQTGKSQFQISGTPATTSPRLMARPWDQTSEENILRPMNSWTGIENSRRYRLMLTYSDHTVISYEIWREAPETGIEGRRNWRNNISQMI